MKLSLVFSAAILLAVCIIDKAAGRSPPRLNRFVFKERNRFYWLRRTAYSIMFGNDMDEADAFYKEFEERFDKLTQLDTDDDKLDEEFNKLKNFVREVARGYPTMRVR